ncbi:long-chain-fatty-acid--CoA ligase [Evansella sp. LMS18]|uniref:class I adenylate-forming enzyme family protein n=1 Tax=Evansella sp. LMS18 TaxID=2924033 RepID=UPI0020CFF900|nr:long-chain-fatty-acid--CoA ligase [Evansella sp. LMS18]UTR12693.1 long-chain-fatty-acid--CoA ligase [Evansella sp. LMS18]
MGATVHGLLERNARKYPEKEAFITSSNRLTYAEMNSKCNQIARLLHDRGIKQGDRVAVMSRNNEHYFYAFFSLMKLGAIPMPVNIRLTPNEIVAILKGTEATGIFYEEELQDNVNEVENHLSLNYTFAIQSAAELAADYPDENLELPIDSRDVCEILYTSGTTGTPKGAVFNHERVLAIASAISIKFNLTNEDVMLTLMPLSHSAPINTFFMGGLYSGSSHVIGDFAPKTFLELIHQEKATFAFAAPIAYLLSSQDPDIDQYDLSSMRVFAYGGGPLALASYQRVVKAFKNENFYQVYGLTESGPNGILLNPEEHHTKAGSIGKYPTVNMELKIVHADGEETKPNEFGEIILSGDSLMLEYYKKPEETEVTIKNGWLYTGDMAYKDEDGYIYIVDRKKDIIISGGVNIYPREIEEVLAKHEAVSESCVIGAAHPEWGETVKAVVVAKEEVTEEELRAFVSNYLADYKCPRIYSFVEELPRNASGKILKQQVKQLV